MGKLKLSYTGLAGSACLLFFGVAHPMIAGYEMNERNMVLAAGALIGAMLSVRFNKKKCESNEHANN